MLEMRLFNRDLRSLIMHASRRCFLIGPRVRYNDQPDLFEKRGQTNERSE